MWKAVHAFSNFDIDIAVVNFGIQVITAHDVRGNIVNADAHVFKLIHGGVEIEIFDVGCAKFGVGSRDDAVEKAFDSSEVRSLRVYVTGIFNSIATHCEANAFGDCFAWTVFCYDSGLGSFFVCGYLVMSDPEESVGAAVGVSVITLAAFS